MPLTLHAATVPSLLQVLRGALGWLDKAAQFAADQGIAESAIMEARLSPDMFPFNRQGRGFAMHAPGGIAGAMKGSFSPEMTPPPENFTGLEERVGEAIAYLEGVEPAAMEELVGKPMWFEFKEVRVPYTADQFLLSFSQPNFYFHATTAYAILRHLGVEVGKGDYLGQLRTSSAPAALELPASFD